ncbi:hypothetical protein C8J57DRAFT_1523969 [Mycena rebaudengoi]|nr:hypothetical protein C8J57DRAFT_1523969 [Mycena rebaudengoi]
MPTFGFHSTAEEVATTFADEIRGKNVIVTGTSLNGLGFETARVISKYANLVVITGHNSDRLKLSEEALKAENPSANVRCLLLDLSSLDAVRASAAEVNAYPEPIHVLINNAASSLCSFELTTDGFERQMATDHLVYVASGAHAWCDGVNLDQMEHPDPSTYKPMAAYAQAKSANILTAIELTKRASGRINAYSLTPGGELPFTLILPEPTPC